MGLEAGRKVYTRCEKKADRRSRKQNANAKINLLHYFTTSKVDENKKKIGASGTIMSLEPHEKKAQFGIENF